VHELDLLLVHTAATWALVGLVWTIQLVQYPGFADVGPAQFAAFHEHHKTRITWIVAPLMLVELVSGLALIAYGPPGLSRSAVWVGVALIGLNWAHTAFVAVPLHARLGAHREAAQRALVATNWIRTIAWSARGAWTLFALRMTAAAS